MRGSGRNSLDMMEIKAFTTDRTDFKGHLCR